MNNPKTNETGNPLAALMSVRWAIQLAIESTAGYGYAGFDKKLEKLRVDAKELFREFDHLYYDGPIWPSPAQRATRRR